MDEWRSMVFCWWMVCIVEAISCVYFKRFPILSEEHYDVKDFTLVQLPTGDDPSASKTQAEFVTHHKPSMQPSIKRSDSALAAAAVTPADPPAAPESWYGSLHDLAIAARQMSSALWAPSSEVHGIPFDVLESLVATLRRWREEHLAVVGVTSDLQSHGDYVTAVGACSTDCTYHVLWIILSQAIEDYGILEVKQGIQPTPPPPISSGTFAPIRNAVPSELIHMIDLERAVAKEAVESATRIAGLAGVLTSNGYMRLDPNAMHWPIFSAGRLLARLGRHEVMNCIDGLNQNGFAYEEAWTQAKQISDTYETVTSVAAAKAAAAHMPFEGAKSTPLGQLPMHSYAPVHLNGYRPEVKSVRGEEDEMAD